MGKYINPNEEQKKAIHINKNAVVAAGAGSGKTSVLAARFVSLIEDKHYNVDEILTLTFTKKATTEMSSRIYDYLQQKCPEQAADFYKANIKTLDSYCSSVAKAGAHYYGISPDFKQDDGTLEQKIQAKGLPFILEHRDNLAIKSFITSNNYEQITRELFINPIYHNSKIASQIDFRKQFENQTKTIFNLFQTTIKNINDNITDLTGAFQNFPGNRNSSFLINIKTQIEDKEIPEAPVLTVDQICNSEYESINKYVSRISEISGISQKGTKEIHNSLKDPLKKLKADTNNLITVINYIYGYKYIKELIPLLEEFQQIVTDIKRTNSLLTFADIGDLAVQTLINFPEIRNQEKEKFKSIMIDEFQDNNSLQRDLLFLLAEKPERTEKSVPDASELIPDKLFFVGDEKQSIYKFRGADVSVFRNLTDQFPEGQLSMSSNFRSHPALIAAFNTFFGGKPYPLEKNPDIYHPSVFYKSSDDTSRIPDYEAVYKDAVIPESRPEKDFSPRVHFANFEKNQTAAEDMLTGTDAEINWIAAKIRELIDNGQEPSSIAVLLRTYTLQPEFEKKFLSYGIPYTTGLITGFFSDGPVNDIFSYLKICVYKNDTVSYSEVLRSPFVNLSVEDAGQIILQQKTPFSTDNANLLTGDARTRYENACSFHEEFCEKLYELTVAEAVTKLWYQAGYRYETIWNQTVEMYSKMYDFIFELARKADEANQTIADFVDNAEIYKNDSSRLDDMDIPLEQKNGINILTIHKSKGLEYDTIFIPNASGTSLNNSNSALTYYDNKYGLTINTPVCPEYESYKTNYFFDSAKETEAAMEAAELRRVVYVALTRAKKEIYITSGKYQKDENAIEKFLPGSKNHPRSIYSVLEPVVNYYLDDENLKNTAPFDIINIPPQERHNSIEINTRKNTADEKIRFINEIARNSLYESSEIIETQYPENNHISPSHLHSPDDETGKSDARKIDDDSIPFAEVNRIILSTKPEKGKDNVDVKPKFDFKDFGSLVHMYMEKALTKNQLPVPEKMFAGLEGNTKNIEKIKNICKQMSSNFLESDLGKLAADSEWIRTEYPFKSIIGNKIINGIMDLVFKTKEGKYIIVDYKTNQVINPEIYYQQLACYRQAISEIFFIDDIRNINCYLYYLRFGTTVDITNESNPQMLEEEIQKIQ